MNCATEQPAGRAATDDTGLWLPPRGLRRYQWIKGLGGCLFACMFVLWAVLARPQASLALVASLLAAITSWVTIVSLVRDRRRARGRQLKVTPNGMHLTTPTTALQVSWSDVQMARWSDGQASSHGLWLYGTSGQPLAHIDHCFLADASEARAFLGWARQHATLGFPVVWC